MKRKHKIFLMRMMLVLLEPWPLCRGAWRGCRVDRGSLSSALPVVAIGQ